MNEKTDVRVFEGASWVCAADWNKLLTSINDLRTSLALALEPVRSWYEKEGDASLDIIVEVVADLQKDRTKMLELCLKISELNKAELRRVAELHDIYTERTNLKADLQRALKDVTMFEDLASKAETARVVRLETCLREIAKSPNCRGVPNWVVLKIQEVVGC